MKKLLVCAAVLMISLTGCNKDIKQLSFSLENLSTLLQKSSDYITQASPGTVDEVDDTYLYYALVDVISGIPKAYIYYDLEDDKCDFINLFSNTINSLDHAEILTNMGEDEAGAGVYFALSYYDESFVLQKVEFESATELFDYIDENSLTIDDVDEILGMYHHNDCYYMTGGYYDDDYDYFISIVEIGFWDDLAMTDGNIISKSDIKLNRHPLTVK